jgi:hypothetical protein
VAAEEQQGDEQQLDRLPGGDGAEPEDFGNRAVPQQLQDEAGDAEQDQADQDGAGDPESDVTVHTRLRGGRSVSAAVAMIYTS